MARREASDAARESVRRQIEAAGIALLKAEGIAALTQPRIARTAGVTQSHLTYYFPTRAALLQAIAEEALRIAFSHLDAGNGATTPVRLMAEIEHAIEEGIPPRVMIGLIVAADSDPEIRKLMRVMIRRIRAAIADQLTQAGFAPDAEQVMLFHATIVGLAVMHLARHNRESALEVKTGVRAAVQRMSAAQRVKRR